MIGVVVWSNAEREKADMNCDRGGGDQSQAVYVLNNWLSNSFGLPDESRASEVNDPVFIQGRAAECFCLRRLVAQRGRRRSCPSDKRSVFA